jgi:hypothetical protein
MPTPGPKYTKGQRIRQRMHLQHLLDQQPDLGFYVAREKARPSAVKTRDDLEEIERLTSRLSEVLVQLDPTPRALLQQRGRMADDRLALLAMELRELAIEAEAAAKAVPMKVRGGAGVPRLAADQVAFVFKRVGIPITVAAGEGKETLAMRVFSGLLEGAGYHARSRSTLAKYLKVHLPRRKRVR